MELPIQLDNVNNRVIDDLKKRLTDKSKIAIAAASFSIYAFEALKDELEKVDELRFIFTSPTFVKEKNKKEKREFYGENGGYPPTENGDIRSHSCA